MKYIYDIIFILILLGGCKKDKNNIIDEKYVQGEATEINLQPQIVAIDILAPTGVLAVDTFLIFVQRHEKEILKVFSNQNFRKIGSFLQKGEGPDDVMLFSRFNQYQIKKNEILLWIQSYPNYIGLLNINKSLESNKVVFDEKYSFRNGSNKTIIAESGVVFNLNDSVFLFRKDPVRSNLFKSNPNPFFVKLNKNTDKVYDTIYINNLKNIDIENELINSTYSVIRPDRKKLAVFSIYMDVLTIIDIDSNKKMKIGLSDLGFNQELAIKAKSRIHYDAFATDSLLFALRKDNKLKSLLYVYDWNGNFLYKIDLNANVLFFSINSKNGMMYGIDEKEQILVYDLNMVL